ncbi:MAG: type and secretion system protein [Gammaproteobacteria bacterium]|nr:type and secretion system protein [Gammaproteobacteria bacterium]
MTLFSRRVAGSVAIVILVAGCAADRLHRAGLAAIERGDYEVGVTKLTEASSKDPHNMEYRLDLQARREAAVQHLVADADNARAAGQLDRADQIYRRVLAIDSNNDRATAGLAGLGSDARHAATVAEARKDLERRDYDSAEAKMRGVLAEDPSYTLAQDLASAVTLARGPTTVAPRLKTRDNRKVTLQFRDAPTKMVFEVLSRETGINFILDKDIKSDGKTTIFVQDVPVEQAIDLVLAQNSLTRQIMASNMVLIYPNNPAKQKEYQEEIVRTFYVTNAAPKDVESMLKTVLGAKTLFIDERANVVVMRDTPDAVRMAEKLVASLDIAEPEVMLEVEILEISRSRLTDLGIAYPTSATLTPSSLATGVGASSGLRLSDLSHQNSKTIGISQLSVTLNAMKQVGLANTLASPRIRARNKEKAKILIGQREPVITNSVTPTAAGTAVVTGSVQYLDVGLTLEVQPTIYLDSDVAIKINLEVSSILKQITTASGTIAYEIGTRNANTLLRLKDGETQILAGLIQDSDTRSANKIPGLGDIPILGRLFGTNHSDREKSEVVLSITPRIIRMQSRPASDTTEFWYGTESRTHSAPLASGASASGGGGSAGPSAPAVAAPGSVSGSAGSAVQMPSQPPMAPAPASPPPQTGAVIKSAPAPQHVPIAEPPAPVVASAVPSPPPPAEASDTPLAGSAAAAPAPPSVPAPVSAPASRPALTLEGPSNARVGEEFDVAVHLSTEQAITRLRSQVRYDSTVLQLVSATTGDVVPTAAGSPTVNTHPGGAQLEIITTPDDPVHGDGGVMTLHFKVLKARPTTNVAAMLSVLGAAGAALGSSAAQPLAIAIQP